MKLNMFLGFVLIAIASSAVLKEPEQRVTTEEAQAIIECARGILSTGDESLNISSLNPLVINEASIDITALNVSGVEGFFNLSSIVFEGLTNFETVALTATEEVNGTHLEWKVNFPALHAHMNYQGDVVWDSMEIWGNGDITLDLTNFALDIKVRIVTENHNWRDFDMLPSLEGFNIVITGFYDDEEQSQLVSQILNDVMVLWVNEKAEEINMVLSPILTILHNQGGMDDGDVHKAVEHCHATLP